jgi:quercetin dioxygenase-like cupin family protein
MKRTAALLLAGLAVSSVSSQAQDPAPPAHVQVKAADVKWGEGPPSLPKGAMLAVMSGDPSKPAPFVVRLKFPAGYKVPPHRHPTAENVTVLSGTLALGMGETFDEAKATAFPAGSYSLMPAEMAHFGFTKAGATVQVHGVGPFAVTYVNPADDPRTAAAPAVPK